MSTRITLPDSYRPWPSTRDMEKNYGPQWMMVPDSYRPYLGDDATGPDAERIRAGYKKAWTRAGIDPEKLGASPPEADSQTLDGEAGQNDTSPVGEVGRDELVIADTDVDDEGRLFYKNVTLTSTGEYVALNAIGDNITDADKRDIVTDADGYPRDLDRRGDLIGIDDQGLVYYLYAQEDKGKRVATTPEGHLLHRGNKPIVLDESNYPEPPEPTLVDKLTASLTRFRTDDDHATSEDVLYDAQGRPVREFDVPGVGKISHTPNKTRKKILAGAAGALLVVGGGGLLAGVKMGTSRIPAQGSINTAEAEEYHLAAFDVNGASAFGRQYLQICLTNGSEQQRQARQQVLQAMQSSTANADCGFVEGGNTQPVMVNFNGQVETRPAESHGDGKIAYLGFNVAMSDGTFSTRVVPIWAGMHNGQASYRVVGNVGEMPAVQSAIVENTDGGFRYDKSLPGTLRGPLQTFFDAWGASKEDDLKVATTSDATGAAVEGMHGQLRNAQISSVEAIPADAPDEIDGTKVSWNYSEGSEVTAIVNVQWDKNTSSEPVTQNLGYRVQMVYTSGKWVVKSLTGGAITPGEKESQADSDAATLGTIEQLTGGGENSTSSGT